MSVGLLGARAETAPKELPAPPAGGDGSTPGGQRPRFALECLAYRETGGQYAAVCLDLALFVRRPALSDAVDELNALVQSYVDDALTDGHPEAWIPRPAPLRTHLRVYARIGVLMALDLLRAFRARFHLGSGTRLEPSFVAHPCAA